MQHPLSKFLILLLLQVYCNNVQSKELTVAQLNTWQKALFYFSRDKDQSIVNQDSPFFLSQSGRTNAIAEIQENLKSLKSDPNYPCHFPYRSRLLIDFFKIDMKVKSCEKYDQWKQRFEGAQVFLVYPTAFPSNPASVMGHTFLRFTHHSKPTQLQETINYAAKIPSDVNFLTYSINGLFGGYPGKFEEFSFYKKIIEYGDIEQRDIWEYELKLTKQERENLIDLIWELKSWGDIDYYFLRENCAFILLALIEAVKPQLDLTSGYGFYITPYMSVLRFHENQLIKDSIYRPSLKKKFINLFQSLSNEDKRQFKKFIETDLTAQEINEKVRLAFINYMTYKEYTQSGVDKSLFSKREEVLKLTSTQAIPNINIKEPKNPLLAHGSRFIEFHGGDLSTNSEFLQLTYRPGVHNKMDPSPGFLPHSSFSFFETDLRWFNRDSKFEISRFRLVDFSNIRIFNQVEPAISWKGRIEMRRRDILCEDCRLQDLQIQGGYAFDLSDKFIFQITGGLNQTISKYIEKGFLTQGLVGIELLKEWDHLKIRLEQGIYEAFFRQGQNLKLESEIELRVYNILPHTSLSAKVRYQKLNSSEQRELVEQDIGILYDF